MSQAVEAEGSRKRTKKQLKNFKHHSAEHRSKRKAAKAALLEQLAEPEQESEHDQYQVQVQRQGIRIGRAQAITSTLSHALPQSKKRTHLESNGNQLDQKEHDRKPIKWKSSLSGFGSTGTEAPIPSEISGAPSSKRYICFVGKFYTLHQSCAFLRSTSISR